MIIMILNILREAILIIALKQGRVGRELFIFFMFHLLYSVVKHTRASALDAHTVPKPAPPYSSRGLTSCFIFAQATAPPSTNSRFLLRSSPSPLI